MGEGAVEMVTKIVETGSDAAGREMPADVLDRNFGDPAAQLGELLCECGSIDCNRSRVMRAGVGEAALQADDGRGLERRSRFHAFHRMIEHVEIAGDRQCPRRGHGTRR